jgi:hypothetical protein
MKKKKKNIIDSTKHLAQFITCEHDNCGNLINISRYPKYQKRYTSRIQQILKMNFELVLMCNVYHGFYKNGKYDIANPCKCSVCVEHSRNSRKFWKKYEFDRVESQIIHKISSIINA